MEKFKIICRKCGKDAKTEESDDYDGEDNYCGTSYTVRCDCGESERVN